MDGQRTGYIAQNSYKSNELTDIGDIVLKGRKILIPKDCRKLM